MSLREPPPMIITQKQELLRRRKHSSGSQGENIEALGSLRREVLEGVEGSF